MKSKLMLLVMSVCLLSLAGCHKPRELPARQQLSAAPVRTQQVEAKKHVAIEEVVGTVRPKLKAVIAAKVSGRIETMLAVPGQAVKQGDLLLQIDAREIQARLDQAKAVRKQAETDLQRITSLFQQGTVPRAELDRVEMQAQVAEATGREVETMLGYAKVTAPFDGLVTRKLADVGDLASPGLPLVEMEDPTVLRLEADVPEALIDRIKLGTKLTVHISAAGRPLDGVVDELDPVADPYSRTFRAKLNLPQTPGLRSGLFGRVAVPVGETTTLRVPASALVVRGQMEIIFVVAGDKAQLRLVKTGKRMGDEWELVSGITAGEQVVTDVAAQLQDGQPVTVK